ncbi:MAG: histone deacetylase [Verrucomicrobia bacterium]|nr:histone deacetylase [Verrucomicrobiota bacterium]
MKIVTDERCAQYASTGHPERPARITRTVEQLRSQSEVPIAWAAPLEADDKIILRAHSARHLARLKEPGDFDGDTPNYPGILEHARRSVGGALQALACARRGEPVFSLLRPPGHHAMRERAMGFCYLSTVAITVLEARATGTPRVAVYDFDVHHGNGTEAILLNQPGTAFFSIHQFPCYPGTGAGPVGNNCFNYPLAPQTPRADYRQTLAKAGEEMKRFKPDLVAVSAGFDAYAHDPLAQETLEAEDYHWLGQMIRQLGVPALSVLEGGYSRNLPELILAYLRGLEGK